MLPRLAHQRNPFGQTFSSSLKTSDFVIGHKNDNYLVRTARPTVLFEKKIVKKEQNQPLHVYPTNY
jgi:hypothetical protein